MNKANNKNKVETLARASKRLMLIQPFYGLFLMMLNKEWDNKKVSTAGVSKNGINYQLTINEHFWNNLSEDWQIGIIFHECLHCAFFHLEMRERFPNHAIANLSMD